MTQPITASATSPQPVDFIKAPTATLVTVSVMASSAALSIDSLGPFIAPVVAPPVVPDKVPLAASSMTFSVFDALEVRVVAFPIFLLVLFTSAPAPQLKRNPEKNPITSSLAMLVVVDYSHPVFKNTDCSFKTCFEWFFGVLSS